MGPWASAGVLIVVTILVAVCAEYLVDSIDSLVSTTGISKTFVGLILLPIVGNAAEHVTAIVVAVKDKMDLAMGVAIGSSMQIALLVTPFLVILGWIIGQPMSLHFQTFETVVFFLSVLVVSYVIGDGKSNYLEGSMVSISHRDSQNPTNKYDSSSDFTLSLHLPSTYTRMMQLMVRCRWIGDLSNLPSEFLGSVVVSLFQACTVL